MKNLRKNLKLTELKSSLEKAQMAQLKGGGVECGSNGSCGGNYDTLVNNALKDMRVRNKGQF